MLALYQDVTLYFIFTDEPKLKISPDFTSKLESSGVRTLMATSLDDCIDQLDVLYMTRIQREHDPTPEEQALRQNRSGCILYPVDRLSKMKEYAAVLHPFPRNEEIPSDIDGDPRAVYFDQAVNGMSARPPSSHISLMLIRHCRHIMKKFSANSMIITGVLYELDRAGLHCS